MEPPLPVAPSQNRVRLAFSAFLVLSALPTAGLAEDSPRARRVVILTGAEVMLPASQVADAEIRRVLSESDAGPFEIHSEGLDAFRFRAEGYDGEFAAFLARKYGETEPALVIAFTELALDFLARHRDRLWPHAPVIFIAVEPSYFASHPRPDWVTGLLNDDDMTETLELARSLVPGARRVVVAAGSGQLDSGSIASVRRDVTRLGIGLEVDGLGGTPIADFPRVFGRLPADTILVYTMMFRDSAGRAVVPLDAARALAAAASVPVFSVHATYLGSGVLGGALLDYAHEGRAAGDLALRVLRGEPPASIPLLGRSPRLHAVDDRVLRRFHIPESRLPAAYERRYRQPTFWEQYRWRIVAVAVAVAAETALLVALLVERRQRRLAQDENRRRRIELSQAARLATVGELAASISHEINQPLGAILANAEAGEMLLASTNGQFEEVREIFAEIRKDDQRASEVVRRVRRLASRREMELKPIDVNVVVDVVLRLLRHDARRHGVALEEELAADLPPVRADEVALQQVLINLALNGMEAMDGIPGERRLVFRTRRDGRRLLVRVSDTGKGIADADRPGLFTSFFTTKPHGVGLGLAICRSIVEGHGGAIEASNGDGGGAAFEFSLPLEDGPGAAGKTAAARPGA